MRERAPPWRAWLSAQWRAGQCAHHTRPRPGWGPPEGGGASPGRTGQEEQRTPPQSQTAATLEVPRGGSSQTTREPCANPLGHVGGDHALGFKQEAAGWPPSADWPDERLNLAASRTDPACWSRAAQATVIDPSQTRLRVTGGVSHPSVPGNQYLSHSYACEHSGPVQGEFGQKAPLPSNLLSRGKRGVEISCLGSREQ